MPIARNKGFTLIELLLVIAIISILSAVGVMVYRQSFQTNRVDTVSLEMQHVLEAAMAFYVDTGAWPTAQPCDSSLQTNTFVTNYLPNGNAMSPLGNQFCWDQAGAPNNRLFWVAVQVPGNATDSLATATRIAGHLPNAVTTSSPDQPDIPAQACTASTCYARAEITVPGTSTNNVSGLTIAATGDCKTGQTIANTGGGTCIDTSPANAQTYQISFPACGSGMQPMLMITPNFVLLPQEGQGFFSASYMAQSTGCSNTSTTAEQGSCSAEVSIEMCSNKNGTCSAADIKDAPYFPHSTPTTEGASYTVVCQKIASVSQGESI